MMALGVPVIEGDIDIVRTFMDPAESPVAYHLDALRYWNERRGDRFAPAWTDLSLMDFPPRVIPMISVTDIIAEPLSSTYRFWGTKLTDIHGADFSGKSPALVPPVALGIANTGGCGRLVGDRAPHLEVKEFRNMNGILGRALVLRMPLSDDGATVNHGLNVYYFEPARSDQPMADFFQQVFDKLRDRPPPDMAPSIDEEKPRTP